MCFWKLEEVHQQSVPESPACSPVAFPQTLPAVTALEPGPAWVPCGEPLGLGRRLQASEELPVPQPTGLRTAASGLFPRMMEHLRPSVVSGPSSFPASLAPADPSPAALDRPIHHTDWCSPINFPAPLVIQTCLKLQRFFSASRMRAATARPAEGCGNGDAMASLFRGGAGSACSPKSHVVPAQPTTGDHRPEELWGWGAAGKALLDLPSCFEVFPENEE